MKTGYIKKSQIKVGDLCIDVIVKEYREIFGREEALVEPINGSGAIYVTRKLHPHLWDIDGQPSS